MADGAVGAVGGECRGLVTARRARFGGAHASVATAAATGGDGMCVVGVNMVSAGRRARTGEVVPGRFVVADR